MSATPPQVAPRKASGIRVMMPQREQLPVTGMPANKGLRVNNGSSEQKNTCLVNAEREVEILNHCFDDVERFMGRLQQTADAQSVVNQRKKKKRKKKKKDQDEDLLTLKACPPSEEEFVDIFQKLKYSFSLLDRLKSSIADPDSKELLHHVFVPLGLMVKTTGGPELGAAVISPALTSGAVSLMQENLTEEEREVWTSLGPNWTSHCSQLSEAVPLYTPSFLDGWLPQAFDSEGQPLEDPIQSQHKQDALRGSVENLAAQSTEGILSSVQLSNTLDGSELPPEGERLFCCSYDFVARNSSELSVLQGETLEVIESSKRWWKCRNRFDQIGFVPFNILEPLSAVNSTQTDSTVILRQSKKHPLVPKSNKYFSFAPSNTTGASPQSPTAAKRPQSMPDASTTLQGDDGERVLMVNDELLQRLANGRPGSVRPLVIPRTADTLAPLHFHSPPSEVEAWLSAKGFSLQTVQSLGILTGAQLFSLNKEELRSVSPEDGVRVYSQIMVQKALLEDVRKATELETVMEKQKKKVDVEPGSGTL